MLCLTNAVNRTFWGRNCFKNVICQHTLYHTDTIVFSVTPVDGNTGSSCPTNSQSSFIVKYLKNAHANLLSRARYSYGRKRQHRELSGVFKFFLKWVRWSSSTFLHGILMIRLFQLRTQMTELRFYWTAALCLIFCQLLIKVGGIEERQKGKDLMQQ